MPGFRNSQGTAKGLHDLAAIDFPNQLDFGKVAINVDASFTCPLAFVAAQPCKWSMTEPSSGSFSLNPSSGMMQGEGVIPVSITFSPSQFITERCNVQVCIDGRPAATCSLMGSAFPGLAREQQLRAYGLDALGQLLPHTPSLKPIALTAGPRRDCRKDGPIQMKLPQVPLIPQDEEVAGTLMPAQVDLASSCSKVLLHAAVRPGPLQASKGLTAAGRKQQQQQLEAQVVAAQAASAARGVSLLDDPQASATLKRAHFAAQLVDLERRGEACRKENMIGSDVQTESQVQRVESSRRAVQQQVSVAQNTADCTRSSPEYQQEVQWMRCAHTNRDKAMEPADDHQAKPTWNANDSSNWLIRERAYKRFVMAARTIIYRHRLMDRLGRLKAYHATSNIALPEQQSTNF
ncbi:hypothetical protein WJX74_009051 [Apatococcus lobatus]|uniref:Uncharacterized protein n=1 Tax=Apatococcus lobatus TaxID=904363 RepID=A0AAW1R0V1_9CHLO